MNLLKILLWLSTFGLIGGLINSLSIELIRECLTCQISITLIMLFKIGIQSTLRETVLSSTIYFMMGGFVYGLSLLAGRGSTFYIR